MIRAAVISLLLLGLGFVPLGAYAADEPVTPHARGELALDAWAGLPLIFEERGVDGSSPGIFIGRGQSHAVVLDPAGVTLLAAPSRLPSREQDVRLRPPNAKVDTSPRPLVRMRLLHANPAPAAVPESRQGIVNYFIGNDPAAWRRSVPTYARVRYRDVYPGIDLVYYGSPQRLEYDFVVAPGSDPSAIGLAVEITENGDGQPDAVLEPDGSVVLPTAEGRLRLHRPTIYQEVDGSRRSVSGRYTLTRSVEPSNGLLLAFEVDAYDLSRPLVIDPILEYATYVGGLANETVLGIALDGSRNTYITGYTASSTFVPGGGSAHGDLDVFVTKLNPSGTVVLYTTFLGGSGSDAGMAIAVDAAGNAHVTGVALAGFPTTSANAAFASPLGEDDAFLAKLSPDGATLLYSTYLGGAGDDAGLGVAVDAAGNAYITGYTQSSDFPASVGDTSLGGPRDAFVAKVNTLGSGLSSLVYGTLLGGTGSDEGHAIAVDTAGNAYVTGATSSTDFPTSVSCPACNPATFAAFDSTLGGPQDAFITKLNATGSVLIYSTYFGGDGDDIGYAIGADTSNRAYVTGSTNSSAATFPLRNAYQATAGGGTDAWVARIVTNLDGSSSRGNTTFLGGAGDDVGLAIALDSANNAYVTGATTSSTPVGGFPTLTPIFPTFGGGTTDAFVAKLSMSQTGAAQLLFSTYLGGTGTDQGNAIAVDSAATVYVAGVTSGSFPTTAGVVAEDPIGGDDAFVAKISQGADLIITTLTIPGRGGSGSLITATVTTKNQGEAAVGASTTKLFYADTIDLANPTELASHDIPGGLAPGASDDWTTTVTLPASISIGTHYVFTVADATNVVTESLESNNRFVRSILIGPDLVVSSLTVSSVGTTLSITDTTVNQGGGDAAVSSTTSFYVSTDATLDVGDGPPVASRTIGPLTAGASSTATTQVTLNLAAGTYNIIAQADGGNAVIEVSETNNTRSRLFGVGVDLTPTTLTAPAGSGAGQNITIDYTVTNNGAIGSLQTTMDLFLSADQTIDAGDTPLTGTPIVISDIAPGAAISGSFQVTLPNVPSGTYSIIARVDPTNAIAETNKNNNTRARSITLGGDLVAYFLNAPSTAVAGSTISISETVRNSGGMSVNTPFTVRIFLSPTATFDPATATELANRTINSLDPGGTSAVSHSVSLGLGTTPGSYFVISRVDAENSVAELSETNNTLSKALTVTSPAQADLVVNFLNATTAVAKDTPFNVSNTVKNVGTAPAGNASTTITVAIHLSTTTGVDGSVAVLQTRTFNGPLNVGASNNASTSVTIPASVSPGNYYIVVLADPAVTVPESNEGNNTASKVIAVSLPDLSVNSLTAPSTTTIGGQISVTDSTRNTGLGDAPQTTTRYYLSLDQTLDPAVDSLIGSRTVDPIARNTTNTGSATVTVPLGFTGSMFIIAQANAGGAAETNTTNNTLARAITIVGPDLVVSSLLGPPGGGADTDIQLTDTVTNSGGAAAGGSITRFYLSTDATLDATDVLLNNGRPLVGLVVSGTSTGNTTVHIPLGTAKGKYFLIAKADADGVVSEINELNNTLARPLNVGPDYVVQSLSAPSASGAGLAITINESTKNQGSIVSTDSVTRYYLSKTPTVDASAVPIGERQISSLGAGLASSASLSSTIPSNTSAGSYYVVAVADATDAIPDEVDETNNTASRAIVIGPDLQVSALTAPTAAAAGAQISITDTTINDGAGNVGGTSKTRYYLSTSPTLDGNSVALVPDRAVSDLAPRAKNTGTVTVTLPQDIAGSFYLIAKADADGLFGEVDEANNTRSRTIQIGADLTLSALSAAAAVTSPGILSVTDTTKNIGSGTSSPETKTKFYLSTDASFDAGDLFLAERGVPALAPNASNTATTLVPIPANSGGNYFLVAVVLAGGAGEVATGNNTRSRGLAIGPDFIVGTLNSPTAGGANLPITVTEGTRNNGSNHTGTVTTSYYLSPTSTLAPGAVPFASRTITNLAAGATSTLTQQITLPAWAPAGRQYLIAKADAPDLIPELDEGNNTRSRAIDIGPDLRVSDMTVPATAAAGDAIQVTDITVNAGTGVAGPFVTSFYLSANAFLDAGDTPLTSRQIINGLNPGASSTGPTTLQLPGGIGGKFYIIAKADGDDIVGELEESNNINAKVILIGPDLVVSALTAPNSARAGDVIGITDTTRNDGAGTAPDSTTLYYLSTDNVLGPTDIPIGSRTVGTLVPSASSTPAAPVGVQIPAGTAPGSYFIIANADGDNLIAEPNEVNNPRTRVIVINP